MSGLHNGALAFIEALGTALKDLDTQLESELQEEKELRQRLESSAERTLKNRIALQSEVAVTADLKLRLQAEQYESSLKEGLEKQRQQVLVRAADVAALLSCMEQIPRCLLIEEKLCLTVECSCAG